MDILAWLLPSGVVLVVMMAWAGWAGRPRREETDRSEAAYERFAEAIKRDHPGAGRPPAAGRAGPQHGDRGPTLTPRVRVWAA